MNELLLKAGTNDYNDNILDDKEISDVSTHPNNIKDASADTKDEQAEAGAVPSSGLVNSLVKIEVIFEFQKKKHDKY